MKTTMKLELLVPLTQLINSASPMKFLPLLRHCWLLALLFALFSFSTAASGRSYAQLEYWHGG